MSGSQPTGITESIPAHFSGAMACSVLDSISAHVAILDERGVILETNQAWNDFACDNAGACSVDFRGVNYLSVCRSAKGKGVRDARKVGEGIRQVIEGEIDEFLYDYPCHSPAGRRWFYMRSIRVAGGGPLRVVVSHEDITALKLAEENVKRQKRDLQEANTALKVLLRQRENDKAELEKAVIQNIKQSVMPYVDRLKRARLKAKDKALVELIAMRLEEVISPLLHRLSSAEILLTPQEIQVASLIKDGKSSKEIAEIMVVSEATVHFHRKNIREKFGIKNQRTNLRSYLMSLS